MNTPTAENSGRHMEFRFLHFCHTRFPFKLSTAYIRVDRIVLKAQYFATGIAGFAATNESAWMQANITTSPRKQDDR